MASTAQQADVKRRKFNSADKAAIVLRHLSGKAPISALSEEYGVPPSVIYAWTAALKAGAHAVFEKSPGPKGNGGKADSKKVAELEAKLARKDEVIVEMSAEFVGLKKELGAI